MTFVIQRRYPFFSHPSLPISTSWRGGVADLTGIGGRFESESVAGIIRNTQEKIPDVNGHFPS